MAMEAAALEEATAAAVAASVAIGEVPLTTPALSKGKVSQARGRVGRTGRK